MPAVRTRTPSRALVIRAHEGRVPPALRRQVSALWAAIFDAPEGRPELELRMTRYANLYLLTAWVGRELVGFKIGYEQKPDLYYSWNGGVAAAHRGRGIARELMRRQHAWCRAKGYPRLRTETRNRWREMLALDLKAGFEVLGTYTDQGAPKIMLEKDLGKPDPEWLARPAKPPYPVHRRGGFEISTDPDRLDPRAIHAYLSRHSYWGRGRSPELVRRSLAGSLCFGLYRGGKQVGFARVVTDQATFAWLADVYVLPAFRGRGLAHWLIATVIADPRLQGLRRWQLATRDAHAIYRRFGFEAPRQPDRLMEKRPDGKGVVKRRA